MKICWDLIEMLTSLVQEAGLSSMSVIALARSSWLRRAEFFSFSMSRSKVISISPPTIPIGIEVSITTVLAMLAATLATLRAIPVIPLLQLFWLTVTFPLRWLTRHLNLISPLFPDFGANFGRGGRRDVGAAQNQWSHSLLQWYHRWTPHPRGSSCARRSSSSRKALWRPWCPRWPSHCPRCRHPILPTTRPTPNSFDKCWVLFDLFARHFVHIFAQLSGKEFLASLLTRFRVKIRQQDSFGTYLQC